MEDVLEVYTRPYDAQRPVVCLDEASKQLVADVTPRSPCSPGTRPVRITSTNAVAPRSVHGVRTVGGPAACRKSAAQRTNADLAAVLGSGDVTYPDADKMLW